MERKTHPEKIMNPSFQLVGHVSTTLKFISGCLVKEKNSADTNLEQARTQPTAVRTHCTNTITGVDIRIYHPGNHVVLLTTLKSS